MISLGVNGAAYFQAPPAPTAEEEFHQHPKKLELASNGPFGKFDNQQVQRGLQVYKEVCAACHAMLATETYSPLPEATPFQTIADTPGMTELALSVWLQSSHPTMPNIVLEQDDMRNVVAYIQSLKTP